MGVWSADAFGNDAACDWAEEFAEDPDVQKAEEKINDVLKEDDYIDSDVAAECLVACEILARLKGNWGERSSYSESIDGWVEISKIKPSEVLVERAARSIDRILGEKSELRELWDEDEPSDEWRSEMSDLKARVLA